MRVYGTSPLFNYIELIFRCKRMFIVSIVLGTLIISLFIYSRSSTYEASMLIALSGDPVLSQSLQSKDPAQMQNPDLSPARRKAGRLQMWVQRTPDFLKAVVEDAQLDKKYPDRTTDMIIRDIRKKLSEPVVLNDMYMELKLTWNNPEEAETIMQRLYSRFSERTIGEESIATVHKRQVLEAQQQNATRVVNEKSRIRTDYMINNFNSLPQLMQASMSQFDANRRALNDAKFDLAESKAKYSATLKQLETTPEFIDRGTEEQTTREDPAKSARQDLETEESNLSKLLLTYSELHPLVERQKKVVAAAQQRVKDMTGLRNRPDGRVTITHRDRNPNYQLLVSNKDQYEQAVRGGQRKVEQLEAEIGRSGGIIKAMPTGQVVFDNIDREYKRAEAVRTHIDNLVTVAKLEEDRDKMTNALNVNIVVQPHAEKVDSGGKVLFLYALGPLLGVLIAFCFSLVVESLDHTLRTPTEVEKYLGKQVLAVIPRMQSAKPSRRSLPGKPRQSITG